MVYVTASPSEGYVYDGLQMLSGGEEYVSSVSDNGFVVEGGVQYLYVQFNFSRPSYSILVEADSDLGTAWSNYDEAYAGQTITITAEPNSSDFAVGEVMVFDSEENIIVPTQIDDTHYQFEMPASDVSVIVYFVG